MKVKFILCKTPYGIDKLVLYNIELPLFVRDRYSIFMKPRKRRNKPITIYEVLNIISDSAYVMRTNLTKAETDHEIREIRSRNSGVIIVGSFQLPIEYGKRDYKRVDNIRKAIDRLANKIKKVKEVN